MAAQGHVNLIRDLADVWQDYLIDRTNPVVMDWPLVGNDQLNIAIIGAYLIFVLWLGPAVMKNRRPFDLRWLMVPYNAALVIANFFIFLEYAKIRWNGGSEISCSTLEFSDHPYTYRLAEVTWWFYISKFIELSDTIFFVLRKKERQLSRLHLIHHSSVPLLMWGMLRTEPGGYNAVFPIANSFVHVLMYTYYGISAIGDHVKIHLRFKKYITMIQLVQFLFVLSHMFGGPFYGCSISWRSYVFNVFIAGFFLILFLNFYWNEYLVNRNAVHDSRNGIENGVLNVKKKIK